MATSTAQTAHKITIVDATPMMADVVSGSVSVPQPLARNGNIWEWLPQTPAIRKFLGSENLKNDGWERRSYDPHLYSSEKIDFSGEFDYLVEETALLRAAAPGQDIFLTAIKRFRAGHYDYSGAYLFALLNPDGTRAAFLAVTHPFSAWSAPRAEYNFNPA